MKIHILSDLHNEFGSAYQPSVTDADVTILAGDIDIKSRGVAWARQTFPGRVLYVPGNHEYYKGGVQHTLAKMKALSCDRVQVLDRDVVVIDGVRFLGATAWTDLTSTGNSPLAEWDARQTLTDYKQIRHTSQWKRWTPSAAREEALRTKEWLAEQLAQPFSGKTVVVSHHAPSMQSIDLTREKPGSHLAASYANAWESLFFGEGLDLWIHGHTHRAVDYTVMGTRVVSNPRGYPDENPQGFNPWLVLDV